MDRKMSRAELVQKSLKNAQDQRKDWASKGKLIKGYLSVLPVFEQETGHITQKAFKDMWYGSNDPEADIAYHYPGSGLTRVRVFTGSAVKVSSLLRSDIMKKPLGKFFVHSIKECRGETFVLFTVTGYKQQWIMTNEKLPDTLALIPRIRIPSAGLSKAIEIMPLEAFLKDMLIEEE